MKIAATVTDNYSILIKGETIKQISSNLTFDDLKADLLSKGYQMLKVERKESLLSFTHPDHDLHESDTLYMFNWKKQICKLYC